MKTTILFLATLIALPAFAQCGDVHALSCPAGVAAALTNVDCVSSDASAYDVWSFNGSAGQRLTVDLNTSSFDAFLVLLDPNGVPVEQNDDALAGRTDARIETTLSAAGTWTIIVDSLAAGQSGDYYLSISSPECPLSGPRRRSVRHE